MFLKRSIVLAAGILLFIAGFITYFDISHAQMERHFRAERERFNVQGAVLTAAEPVASSAPVHTAVDTNAIIGPVPPTNTDAGAAPAAAASDTNAPAATSDTNAAPSPTAAPDTNSAPTPSTPDTNAAPTPPASSTLNDRPANRSPFVVFSSFHSFHATALQMAAATIGDLPATSTTAVPEPPPTPSLSTPLPPGSTQVAPAPAPAATPAAVSANPAAPSAHSAGGDGKVIVLLYHQFKPAGVAIPQKFQWTMNQDVFASEMKYIHDNGYHVIPMSDLLKFLRHEITLPNNSVCITVDDGYKSAVVYAAPILKQYGYPWTFFIYPEFVTVAEGSGAVSWNDLLELQKEGVDIECHSMTHPILKSHRQKIKGVMQNLTPDEYAAWLVNETAGAKAILEEKMGKKIICFAYPYGEYNQQVQDAVIAAGYEAIFTVADNPVHASTNLHSIGRYTITQGVEKNFTAYLRQGALEISSADPAPGATTSNPRPVITATLGYAGTLDPKSIEASVRDFGDVRHDFDPQTNTLRLYLPRDLIQPVVLVNIRVKDASNGQIMVANWHFNYEATGAAANALHAPIAPATNMPAVSAPSPTTTAPAAPEPLEKSAAGTPLDAHPDPATAHP
jgi:peptidoglycan/xylan/chitin deacetylase (PgdA/CDA1 family)